MQAVSKKLSDRKLFTHALVFAVEPDGTVSCFATPAVWQEHVRNQDILKASESAIVKNLSQDEKTALLAEFGSPPTCKAAFKALNNNSLRLLLRAMGFDQLQGTFADGNEERMHSRIHTHIRTQKTGGSGPVGFLSLGLKKCVIVTVTVTTTHAQHHIYAQDRQTFCTYAYMQCTCMHASTFTHTCKHTNTCTPTHICTAQANCLFLPLQLLLNMIEDIDTCAHSR